MNRNVLIIVSVVFLHVAALWGLQSGLLRRAVEVIVPAEILSEFIEPPAPKVIPPPAPPRLPVRQPVAKASVAVRSIAPEPMAITDPTPSPNVPTGVTVPATVAAPIPTPVAAGPTVSARVEMPSSDAAYLQNPKPPYPAMSKRLVEQGKVVVRVLIGVDGNAQKAEVKQSSGFERLDQAALGAVLRWRYVPGKRDGVPEAMWFNVPISFVLE